VSEPALRIIEEQITEAIRAPKCHRCGCLQKTVEALAETQFGRGELTAVLSEAKSVFVSKEYDCLGCPICYPAIAANAFAEAYPEEAAGLDLCPTEEPIERMGWPPLPGDYNVVRYQAPVAVCTLNSSALATEIRNLAPAGLSIVGTLHTENLGIERLIRNVVGNPNIRFLILCGGDTQQRVGHLPGQSLASLFANGIDKRSRIIGAQGKRPVLKNVTAEEVAAFRRNVELVEVLGEELASVITNEIARCTSRNPGLAASAASHNGIETVLVDEAKPLLLDPKGYFVVYPESRRRTLVLEHYTNKGVLDAVLEGHTAGPLYQAAISRNLVSRLDHSAYLGRELAHAEQSLKDGTPYIQDRATEPEQDRPSSVSSCECSEGSCQ
jgi:tetrahydromethanopterin S-methyltransferase subunit A